MTKVRLTRKFAQMINGIDLTRVRAGDDVELSAREADMLIAEGWATPAAEADDRPASVPKARVPHPKKTTVLVVDDDPAVHSFLSQFLRTRGHAVTGVDAVDKAVAMLERSTFDAVVLDVRMPRRSGLQVLEYVRQHERLKNLPVLIFTGMTLTSEEEAVVAKYGAYVFYKQESLDEFAGYIDRLTATADQ